jgi:hypothetical protein
LEKRAWALQADSGKWTKAGGFGNTVLNDSYRHRDFLLLQRNATQRNCVCCISRHHRGDGDQKVLGKRNTVPRSQSVCGILNLIGPGGVFTGMLGASSGKVSTSICLCYSIFFNWRQEHCRFFIHYRKMICRHVPSYSLCALYRAHDDDNCAFIRHTTTLSCAVGEQDHVTDDKHHRCRPSAFVVCHPMTHGV